MPVGAPVVQWWRAQNRGRPATGPISGAPHCVTRGGDSEKGRVRTPGDAALPPRGTCPWGGPRALCLREHMSDMDMGVGGIACGALRPSTSEGHGGCGGAVLQWAGGGGRAAPPLERVAQWLGPRVSRVPKGVQPTRPPCEAANPPSHQITAAIVTCKSVPLRRQRNTRNNHVCARSSGTGRWHMSGPPWDAPDVSGWFVPRGSGKSIALAWRLMVPFDEPYLACHRMVITAGGSL